MPPEHLTRGLPPPDPRSLCPLSSTEFVEPPPPDQIPGYATVLLEFCSVTLVHVGRVAQSVWRLATGWTVRGSTSCGGEIFRTCPDRPWGPPSLMYNGYRVFPGDKERPGRDADPSPSSCAVVKKE
jgi:hypothetical protein